MIAPVPVHCFSITFLSKLVNDIFHQKYVHMFENNVITCSQLTVINVHVIIFVYISRSCHNYAQEVIKMADQNAAALSKTPYLFVNKGCDVLIDHTTI